MKLCLYEHTKTLSAGLIKVTRKETWLCALFSDTREEVAKAT